jgi:hypothetical protein
MFVSSVSAKNREGEPPWAWHWDSNCLANCSASKLLGGRGACQVTGRVAGTFQFSVSRRSHSSRLDHSSPRSSAQLGVCGQSGVDTRAFVRFRTGGDTEEDVGSTRSGREGK